MFFLEKPDNFNPKLEVVGCFLQCRGEFLLLHRAPRSSQPNTWAIPAGKMEKGEDMFSAILREVKEEIGFILNEDELNYFQKVYIKYPDIDIIYHMFYYKVPEKPLVILNEEHTEYQWLNPVDSLKLDLIPDEAPCIKLFYKMS